MLTHFPIMTKGLGPALVCEFSGLPWKGARETGFTRDEWVRLKARGICPFGQLPLLEVEGMKIVQSSAIVNYVGRKAKMNGKTPGEFAMSQVLLAEAEDMYVEMFKFVPSTDLALGQQAKDGLTKKGDKASFMKFFVDWVPGQMGLLEGILLEHGGRFTTHPPTVGELCLWAVLHELMVCVPETLDGTEKLRAFYRKWASEDKVLKVLNGDSHFGAIKPYFGMPP